MCVLTRGAGQRIRWFTVMGKVAPLLCTKHAMASLLYQRDHGIAGSVNHKNAALECAVSYVQVGMEPLRERTRLDGHTLYALSIFRKFDLVT